MKVATARRYCRLSRPAPRTARRNAAAKKGDHCGPLFPLRQPCCGGHPRGPVERTDGYLPDHPSVWWYTPSPRDLPRYNASHGSKKRVGRGLVDTHGGGRDVWSRPRSEAHKANCAVRPVESANANRGWGKVVAQGQVLPRIQGCTCPPTQLRFAEFTRAELAGECRGNNGQVAVVAQDRDAGFFLVAGDLQSHAMRNRKELPEEQVRPPPIEGLFRGDPYPASTRSSRRGGSCRMAREPFRLAVSHSSAPRARTAALGQRGQAKGLAGNPCRFPGAGWPGPSRST